MERAHDEPIGDLKTVAGIEPNILNSKVSQDKTCDDNSKKKLIAEIYVLKITFISHHPLKIHRPHFPLYP